MTPMEGFSNITEGDIPYLSTWHAKPEPKVYWRGTTTGGYSQTRDWRESHRMRLHLMVNGPKGGDRWWDLHAGREVMMPDGLGGFDMIRRRDSVLGKAYADTKLAGRPEQCPSKQICQEVADTIEFAPRSRPEEAEQYRYALDLDGNGWSSRFHRLLSSGSAVIKSTMYPEWHMDWLSEWI